MAKAFPGTEPATDKQIVRQTCTPYFETAAIPSPGTSRRRTPSRANGETSALQSRHIGRSRPWILLAAGASLLFATTAEPLAARADVTDLDHASEGVNHEGVDAHEVARAREEFNVDGSGVTVCVLSDSVRHLDKAKSITREDVTVLPGQNGIQEDAPDENKDKHKHKDKGEGTAMLEIIHSIAPGAKLMFATQADMVKNIRDFAKPEAGCKIIVDDKTASYEFPFQDDDTSKAVNDVTDKGILYVTSAGNRGNTRAGTSMAWEGLFQPGRALKDSRGMPIRTMHVFTLGKENGEYNEVLGECGREGGEVDVHLFWNDPLPKVQQSAG